jgi:hypothetical protein
MGVAGFEADYARDEDGHCHEQARPADRDAPGGGLAPPRTDRCHRASQRFTHPDVVEHQRRDDEETGDRPRAVEDARDDPSGHRSCVWKLLDGTKREPDTGGQERPRRDRPQA